MKRLGSEVLGQGLRVEDLVLRVRGTGFGG